MRSAGGLGGCKKNRAFQDDPADPLQLRSSALFSQCLENMLDDVPMHQVNAA